jgi:hypothetical protein|eukprot:COSAG06_NODE_3727_length_4971_cov_2.507389_2_plen_61_part_00
MEGAAPAPAASGTPACPGWPVGSAPARGGGQSSALSKQRARAWGTAGERTGERARECASQ